MSDSSVTPWTVAHQAPLSIAFPKQEYWSGLPSPSPGDLPDSGIKPTSPVWQADSLTLSHPGSPLVKVSELIRESAWMLQCIQISGSRMMLLKGIHSLVSEQQPSVGLAGEWHSYPWLTAFIIHWPPFQSAKSRTACYMQEVSNELREEGGMKVIRKWAALVFRNQTGEKCDASWQMGGGAQAVCCKVAEKAICQKTRLRDRDVNDCWHRNHPPSVAGWTATGNRLSLWQRPLERTSWAPCSGGSSSPGDGGQPGDVSIRRTLPWITCRPPHSVLRGNPSLFPGKPCHQPEQLLLTPTLPRALFSSQREF